MSIESNQVKRGIYLVLSAGSNLLEASRKKKRRKINGNLHSMEGGRGLYMVFVLMELHISTIKDLEEKKDIGKNILMT